jgi:hypothetical protein
MAKRIPQKIEPRFSTDWEREDYERGKRGESLLGPFGAGVGGGQFDWAYFIDLAFGEQTGQYQPHAKPTHWHPLPPPPLHNNKSEQDA